MDAAAAATDVIVSSKVQVRVPPGATRTNRSGTSQGIPVAIATAGGGVV